MCDTNRKSALVAFGLAWTLSCQTVFGGIRYHDFPDQLVKGTWLLGADGSFEVFDETLTLDLNEDAIDDVQLSHGFVLQPILIAPQAVPYIDVASMGMHVMHALLQQIRNLALDAANTGVNDAEKLVEFQAMIDDRLDAMQHLATHTEFQGRILLDGSSGITGFASDSHVSVNRATRETVPADYAISVTTAGELAHIVAPAAQNVQLASDEVLTVNGVSIALNAGFDQVDVINRINDFTVQTGVFASDSPSGATRIQSVAFGRDAVVEAISNIPAHASSSGFGTTTLVDVGVNAQVEIGDDLFQGNGATVIADHGDARDLAITLRADNSAWTQTVSGPQGIVSVVDQSLVFSGDDGDTALTLPNLQPTALALGHPDNPFANLSEIQVVSEVMAQDSLSIIDLAMDEIRSELIVLDGLAGVVAPEARNSAVGLDGTQLLVLGDEIVILGDGDLIGPGSTFWTSGNDVTYPANGYVGVEMLIDGETHYGWLGIATDFDGAILVRDFAYETVPLVPISAGVVPEPKLCSWLMVAVVVISWRGLLRRNANER